MFMCMHTAAWYFPTCTLLHTLLMLALQLAASQRGPSESKAPVGAVNDYLHRPTVTAAWPEQAKNLTYHKLPDASFSCMHAWQGGSHAELHLRSFVVQGPGVLCALFLEALSLLQELTYWLTMNPSIM